MILLLSGGGIQSNEISLMLQNEGISHLCVFSSLKDAGNFGKGNVVVGQLHVEEMVDLLCENAITAVIDAIEEGDKEQSLAAISACDKQGVPYIKYLHMADICAQYHSLSCVESYEEIGQYINKNHEPVLFYCLPETVRGIKGYVSDKSCLFVPILRQAGFDVSLGLEYGIPLFNVKETDGIDGVDEVRGMIRKLWARLLICDGSCTISDKILAAEEEGISVIYTHKFGMSFPKTTKNPEDLISFAKAWEVK